MWDDEQSAGERVLRVGKKDSPNWFMLAGGAVVMAISVALGRRKILREEEMVKKVSIAGAGISVLTHEDDETCSVTHCRSKCEAKMQQFMTCKSALSKSKTLEANLEVKGLHRQLNPLRINRIADVDEVCIDIAVAEIKRHQDVEKLVLEARKSLERVECLEREKEVRVRLLQAKSRHCELLCKKVSILTMELEEMKAAAQEKQRLLEAKEQENLKLASLLEVLQHKIEYRSDEWAKSSKLSKQINTKNKQSSWKRNYDVDHAIPTNYKELLSTFVGGS